MATKKNTESSISKIVKTFTIIAGVITILSGAVVFFIDYGKQQEEENSYRKEMKTVTFESQKQRDKAVEYVNANYTPLSVYLQNDTVRQHQDSLLQQQKELKDQQANIDTILNSVYQQREEFLRSQKIKDSIVFAENEKLKKNRAEKYKLQERILDELKVINLRKKHFKKQLDSIKQ